MGRSVLRPYIVPDRDLIVAKGDERIDLGGSAGRKIAGGNGDRG